MQNLWQQLSNQISETVAQVGRIDGRSVVRSSDFRWAPGQNIGNYPCQIVTELVHEQGWVPHWLPGENPDLDFYSKTYGVIQEAARGGASTVLPEFRKKVVAGQTWPPPVQPAAGGRGGGPGGPGGGDDFSRLSQDQKSFQEKDAVRQHRDSREDG